jgi:hypothetical protein
VVSDKELMPTPCTSSQDVPEHPVREDRHAAPTAAQISTTVRYSYVADDLIGEELVPVSVVVKVEVLVTQFIV